MTVVELTKEDVEQIKNHGLNKETVIHQLETFLFLNI